MKRVAILTLALALVAAMSMARENMVGNAWGAGTTTIPRYLEGANLFWNVSIAPDAQNVSVIFYYDDGSDPPNQVIDTLTVRAGEIWNSPEPLYIARYDILRPTSTDGIDYATLSQQNPRPRRR